MNNVKRLAGWILVALLGIMLSTCSDASPTTSRNGDTNKSTNDDDDDKNDDNDGDDDDDDDSDDGDDDSNDGDDDDDSDNDGDDDDDDDDDDPDDDDNSNNDDDNSNVDDDTGNNDNDNSSNDDDDNSNDTGNNDNDNSSNDDDDNSNDTGNNDDTGNDVDTGDDDDTGDDETGDDSEGAYFVAGDWKGHGWSGTGEAEGGTINEITQDHTFGQDSLCVTGSLALDYGSLGLIGMNISQAEGGDAQVWNSGGSYTGVHVELSTTMTSTIRIELTGDDGQVYCAELDNGTNNVSWRSFATECWGTEGSAFSPSTGIETVQIYAAGDEDTAISFDYCVEDLYPMSGGGNDDTGNDDTDDGDTGSNDSSDACSVTTMPSGGSTHAGSNGTGGSGNLAWELWANNPGNSSITTYSSPALTASWNNAGDYLARIGYEWGCWNCSPKPHDQYGTIKANFNYTKSGDAGGYSYIGIYGWTTDPCVEWYIVDDSFNTMPFNPGSTTNMGEVDLDGGTYIIYLRHTTGTGGSRCSGVNSWDQYYSVRKTGRTCGTISISEHFKAWDNAGLSMAGNLLEAKILVEAGGGVGSAEFPLAEVTATNP